ncbi:NAD(P)/FAD-dependent oxidoreductase [Streptomyces eurythermus]|uniref:NAD(P)/FAD-dependent oxidoreductase n=1 Tax=Streptomyces eurythermus TaxID=42237 RepID=UPI0036D39FA4
MTEHSNPSKVVVLGGGYAGTLAANRLRTRADVDITLVNPRPEFVERVRLHQFVARTGTATLDYGTLLGEGVHLVVDTATRIDTAGRTVRLASGRTLDYDYLAYAVGSTSATPAAVPGAAELALSVAEFESARRLRARLEEVPRDAPVTVVGGGLTGIETAAELAERGRRVTLVCGRTLAPSLGAPGRRYVAKWLTRHGVTVLEGGVATEVRPDAVVLADGSADGATRPSALTVWAAGFGVPELAAASGLRTDALGRLLTDETLTSLDDDRIAAAGGGGGEGGRGPRADLPPGAVDGSADQDGQLQPRARGGGVQRRPPRRRLPDRDHRRRDHRRLRRPQPGQARRGDPSAPDQPVVAASARPQPVGATPVYTATP